MENVEIIRQKTTPVSGPYFTLILILKNGDVFSFEFFGISWRNCCVVASFFQYEDEKLRNCVIQIVKSPEMFVDHEN